MPKKSILISSGSTKRWEAPLSRFTYDTDTQYVSIENLSASQLVLTGAVSGVLISSGGVVTAYKASENSGSYLVTDGTKWTVGSAGNASIGPVSGDLSGSYPNPTFKNIGNVNTGYLPIARGGFSGSNNYNLLSSIPSGSLILASGTGSLTVVSTASYVAAASNGDPWVLASVSGTTQWAAVTASAPERDVNVQFFTCSNPLTSSTDQVWTKMNPNHKWARVMLQGGGGGGAGNGISFVSCAGGSGGGFTDVTVYIGSLLSASIFVGAGGSGSNASGIFGRPGVSSSFSASNIFISAGGGYGGDNGTTRTGSVGGIGLTYYGGNGGAGAAPSNLSGAPTEPSVGASGGGHGANQTVLSGRGFDGGISGLYYVNTLGGTGVISGSGGNGNYSPLFGYNIPVGIGSGGGGGGCTGSVNNGGNGVFGGGGGGAGRRVSLLVPAVSASGGNGGDGFVVVVSY